MVPAQAPADKKPRMTSVRARTTDLRPGFPRWIEAARPKALEFLAKTQIPTFTRPSVTRSLARSWQTLEPRAEFALGIREQQAYLGNPGYASDPPWLAIARSG